MSNAVAGVRGLLLMLVIVGVFGVAPATADTTTDQSDAVSAQVQNGGNLTVYNITSGDVDKDYIGQSTFTFENLETGETFTRTNYSSSTTPIRVDMSGLPDGSYLVTFENADYLTRTTFIENVSKDQKIWTKSDDGVSQNDVQFKVEDRTDSYPPEKTRIIIQRAVNSSGSVDWRTVQTGFFGTANRFNTQLVDGQRYQLVVENQDGDRRIFSSYLADTANDVQTLRIGNIEVIPPKNNSFVFEAQKTTKVVNNIPEDAIKFTYLDASETTQTVEVQIFEIRNRSNTIYGPQTFTSDSFSTTVVIPSNQTGVETWVVEYDVVRDAGNSSGRVLVGELGDLNIPIPTELLSAIGIGSILLVAGLFGGTLSKIGGIVTVTVAWVLTAVGIVDIPLSFLLAAMTIAVLFNMGASKPEVSRI